MNLFINEYNKQLKRLCLTFTVNQNNNIKNTLKYVSLLENLDFLRIELELFSLPQNNFNNNEVIDESLKTIGQKCLKLSSLEIYIFGDLISDNVFKIFGQHFHGLN